MNIPIDPTDKPREGIAHLRRSEEELRKWRNRPFIVTAAHGGYEIRCLDGLVRNGTTIWGKADTVKKAEAIAREPPPAMPEEREDRGDLDF